MGKARLYNHQTKIGTRITVHLQTGESIIGRLLNIEFRDGGSVILSDAEKEVKTKKNSNVVKRSFLGFVIIRASNIVSIGGHGDNASPVGASNHVDSLAVVVKSNNNNNQHINQPVQQHQNQSGLINYDQMMRENARR